MDKPKLANLRLLQLLSPNLPTGAFTYSQGLEWAVECGWLKNVDDTQNWLLSILKDNLCCLELPILTRLYQAANDQDTQAFHDWSERLYVSRETLEFRNEETQRARALYNVIKKLPDSERWSDLQEWSVALHHSQLASFALAANHWDISLLKLMQAYVWSWLENTVAAAIKLVPLGQTDGQFLLYELSNEVALILEQALQTQDDEIGASSPAQAIASSLHETQYSRLFRS